jgi:hypothetical protein
MGAVGGSVAFISFLLEAPLTGGISLIPAMVAGSGAVASGAGAVVASELVEGNAKIYFKITGDDSE